MLRMAERTLPNQEPKNWLKIKKLEENRLVELASVLCGKAEGAGLVQPEEEKAERGPDKCL